MKNILLLHPEVLFYKVPIYNKLSSALQKEGYNLIIWAPSIQNKNEKIIFDTILDKMTLENYKKVLKNNNIQTIVNILFPSIPSYTFYLASIFYAKWYKKEIIYYGHGINLEKSNSNILRILYNIVHLFFDKIILYTPNEKKFLWKNHYKKVFIAYNTLDLEGRSQLVNKTKDELRKQYNLGKSLVILFSGRIQKRKKLDILINILKEYSDKDIDIKLVIVGPDLDENSKLLIDKIKNIIYLGPIYDKKEMAEIFYMSDVYCIPGHIGLGLIEAFYWGKPVVTMDVKHAPEIYYMKDGWNGYILNSIDELTLIFEKLLNDKLLLNNLSHNAKLTYENDANINKMIEGFILAIKSNIKKEKHETSNTKF